VKTEAKTSGNCYNGARLGRRSHCLLEELRVQERCCHGVFCTIGDVPANLLHNGNVGPYASRLYGYRVKDKRVLAISRNCLSLFVLSYRLLHLAWLLCCL